MTESVRHVVMFSGGIGSWAAALRVRERHPDAPITLLFCDTNIEDADLYRFLDEAAADVRGDLVRLDNGGRTPWDVFAKERFLGNSRIDPCSKILKRQAADAWITGHCDVSRTIVYVGIDWSEVHRFTRLRERKLPWQYEAPLCDPPYVNKHDLLALAISRGLVPPRLYALGFAHNNCGGGCVKAGVGHFTHLYRTLPHVYAEWERNEETLRGQLGDVSILRHQVNGEPRLLPLTQLRRRLDDGYQPDLFEIGGCGCMIDEPDTALSPGGAA